MRTILLLTLLSFISIGTYAQDEDTTKTKQLVLVTKNDGAEYIGEILKDDGREILLMTEALGKIYIPKSTIKSIVKIEDEEHIINGSYNTEGPFTTRYSFTTNALPIKKGENYAMVNLYGPEVHFAVTDNFNIGVMSTWIASPLVVAMKYSAKIGNENINLSAGLLAGTSGYLNGFRGYGGLAFGNITIGDRRRNLTFSAGFLFIDPDATREEQFISEGVYTSSEESVYSGGPETYPVENIKNNLVSSPIFSVAGYHKVGPKAAFVFDSMIGVFKSRLNEEVTTTTLSQPVGNPWDSFYVPGEYRHQVSHTRGNPFVAFYIMPGMRFQKNEKRAFQVSLAGVTVIDGNDVISFPAPTLQWYFKF